MVSEISSSRSVVVESKPPAVFRVWKGLLSSLEANNFSQDDIFAVHLALEEAFINAVNAQRGKKISETDADVLIAVAQQIIDLLSSE